ncbi:uncharacterized protein N7473_008506 [Penicillium subrubescens]|uniref:Uncharacterized protein n=1 Tax=Penicillium subrubescens TaxID=1316194 RepID=A0A1Q5TEZ4_9EURO|nr:uncharacterized protein N7473_008506 [Penicillium subrubescens]KAJ5892278.1 hypothetical protein N7473_008506 [Penicillium subrubescens]OKO98755.1 hypothetical protein PENSUB_9006 [Penicillium subrubescens]
MAKARSVVHRSRQKTNEQRQFSAVITVKAMKDQGTRIWLGWRWSPRTASTANDQATTPPPVISLGRIDIARGIQVLVVHAPGLGFTRSTYSPYIENFV